MARRLLAAPLLIESGSGLIGLGCFIIEEDPCCVATDQVLVWTHWCSLLHLLQARCQLGNKYGALLEDCSDLLATAQQLNIQVVGVAFHVGSGATNPQAFADAIAAARLVCHPTPWSCYVCPLPSALCMVDVKLKIYCP